MNDPTLPINNRYHASYLRTMWPELFSHKRKVRGELRYHFKEPNKTQQIIDDLYPNSLFFQYASNLNEFIEDIKDPNLEA